MKVLVVGGGGREHAVIEKLSQSEKIDKLYAAPGNGGIAAKAECVDIKATDVEGICSFAKNNGMDFVVVTPDDPLCLGMVDRLEKEGIKAFGPEKKAAVIEGSKIFAKELMKKYGIPTAPFEIFDDPDKACEYIDEHGAPIVIKADGLALGKGVTVAKTTEEAKSAVFAIMKDKIFGESGNRIVIEDCLCGPEVSVLAFTDGKTIKPMVSSQDHKRAYDNDEGPNTGGMGTFAPSPLYTGTIAEECVKKIFVPTVRAMNSEDRKFKGVLYFGLMLTEKGVMVIEYNARFGDPETQVVLPLLKTDLFDIMTAVTDERLDEIDIEWEEKAAACVVMASGGYPKKYETGYEIFGLDKVLGTVYHAGTKEKDGKFFTSGGRVLGVTAVGETLAEAVKAAYSDVGKISFKNAFFRQDIGKK